MELDFETGKLVVGHRVKLIGQDCRGIILATLVQACRDYAVVKPARHGRLERVEWKYVRYDKVANASARTNGRVKWGRPQ